MVRIKVKVAPFHSSILKGFKWNSAQRLPFFCYLQIRKNDGKRSFPSPHLLAARHCPFSKPWLVAMLPGSEGEEGRRGGELRETWPQACHVIGNVHTTPHGVNEEAPILLPSTHIPPVKLCLIVMHLMVRKLPNLGGDSSAELCARVVVSLHGFDSRIGTLFSPQSFFWDHQLQKVVLLRWNPVH